MNFKSGASNAVIITSIVVVIIVIAGVSLIALPSLSRHSTTNSSISTSTTTTHQSTSSASTYTSVGISSTLSCPVSTTATSSSAQSPDLAPLFGNYSAMSGYLYELGNQKSATLDSNYTVVSTNASSFTVSIESNITGSNVVTIVSLLKNGTAVSASQAGYNYTGSKAEALLLEAMDPFLLETSQSKLTPTPAEVGASVANQSTITLGPTTMNVSNYASNKLPATLTQCTTTQTVTKFEYQTGTPAGGTFPLLTVFDVEAYQVVSGQHSPIAVVFELTSVTVG